MTQSLWVSRVIDCDIPDKKRNRNKTEVVTPLATGAIVGMPYQEIEDLVSRGLVVVHEETTGRTTTTKTANAVKSRADLL